MEADSDDCALCCESILPRGPVHTVFTVTETSTVELNSTVQVRVTVDPIVTGFVGTVVILILGTGTVHQHIIMVNQDAILIYSSDEESMHWLQSLTLKYDTKGTIVCH